MTDNRRAAAIADLEQRLGHVFADRALLERALTHASVGQGARTVADYERLEFLGDRVLGLLTAEALVRRHPEAREGELSRRLHALVSREACARVGRRIGLGAALRLSPAESRSGGRDKETVLGDACEALIAALYLDAGLEAARACYADAWREEVEGLPPGGEKDAKTALQEWAAATHRVLPRYAIVERSGPDHAPTFVVEAVVDGAGAARGMGSSRQAAEKQAAQSLLARETQA